MHLTVEGQVEVLSQRSKVFYGLSRAAALSVLGVKLTDELECEANRRECCWLQLNGWVAVEAGGSGWHQAGEARSRRWGELGTAVSSGCKYR